MNLENSRGVSDLRVRQGNAHVYLLVCLLLVAFAQVIPGNTIPVHLVLPLY